MKHNAFVTIYGSTSAPDPSSNSLWMDLGEDPNGSVLKSWTGEKYEPITKSIEHELESIEHELEELSSVVESSSTTLEGLSSIVEDSFITIENGVVDNDFSNGISGWYGINGTLSLNTQGDLEVEASGLMEESLAVSDIICSDGDKIYQKVKVSTDSDSAESLSLGVIGYDSADEEISRVTTATIATPNANQEYLLEGMASIDIQAESYQLAIYQTHETPEDGDLSITTVSGTEKVLSINLTEAFGHGNEPTLLEFKALLEKIPTTWFDESITISQKQIMDWHLALIRANN